MSDGATTKRNGVSGLTLLTLLFIGLKLSGHIQWSWVWVLAPTWIPIVIAVIVLGIVLLINGGGD